MFVDSVFSLIYFGTKAVFIVTVINVQRLISRIKFYISHCYYRQWQRYG